MELERSESELVWELPPAPVVGCWDWRRVGIAVRNLLSNAVKFGPGRPIEITVREEDGQVRVSVRDHGPGLTPEERRRLFERFVRPAFRPALRRVRAGPVDRAPHRRGARRSRRRVERTGRRITLLVRPPARQLTGRREPEGKSTPRRRRSASFSARVVDKRTEPGNRDGPSLEAARGAVRTHGDPRQRPGWNRIGRGATKDLSTDLQCGPIASKGIGWNPGIARAGDPDWRLRSSRAWSVNMGSASSTLSETEA